ncbi:hypothetical protein HK102_003653, partial [Quaeritorhiza haematococci]
MSAKRLFPAFILSTIVGLSLAGKALPPANPDGTCVVYTVQPGDWLSKIADAKGLPVEVLKLCNPQITNYDLIHPGQLICLSAGTLPSELPPANPDGTCKTYTVQPGDWLSKIADRHGLTLDVIKRCNPQITNHDLIHPGQLICLSAGSLPSELPPANPDGTCKTYKVQHGDWLSKIADRHGLTLDVIKRCNPQIRNYDLIYPHQLICLSAGTLPSEIPPANPDGTCKTYTVQPGDWLSTIADRHELTLDTIKRCNPQITNHDLIHPGQLICLSEGSRPGQEYQYKRSRRSALSRGGRV